MALVSMKEMLCSARREKRALGAFNVANYETALGVFKAAEAEKSPVIIQVYMRLFTSEKAWDLAGTLLRLARRAEQSISFILTSAITTSLLCYYIPCASSSSTVRTFKAVYRES